MSTSPPDDTEAMRDALRRAAVALGRADIRYALCGGYAAWARGAPEPVHDVDFVIGEADVDAARAALVAAGLDVREPAEDWLFKAFNDGGAMVDVLFRMCGEPVADDVFERTDVLEVAAVRMPVLGATDVMWSKLKVLNEHYCDYARLLPVARALREQIDWEEVRSQVDCNPFAESFLVLLDRLAIAPA